MCRLGIKASFPEYLRPVGIGFTIERYLVVPVAVVESVARDVYSSTNVMISGQENHLSRLVLKRHSKNCNKIRCMSGEKIH